MALTKDFTFKELTRILSGLATPVNALPVKRMLVDYDAEADVVYLSFARPQKATDSELLDNGVIVRRRGKQIVGLTILDATARARTKTTKSANGAASKKKPA